MCSDFCADCRRRGPGLCCSLVIKLFSPSVQHGGKAAPLVFPVTVRLLRIMDVLIRHFYTLLSTEAEIFLSMLIKFLEAGRAAVWQRVAALEVVHGTRDLVVPEIRA